jgi:hypothetical protein
MNLATGVSAIYVAGVLGLSSLGVETAVAQASDSLAELRAIAAERQCETGPVAKTYASTKWLVYGCAKSKTLRFDAARGNPSWPFVITFKQSGDAYKVQGGGDGNPVPGYLALDDIRKLSASDISALLDETQTKR